ncbi:MAG: methyltransferase domain-containing protein, partial [Phycisphaerae bacterium]|nr:methyltransferase domain-containing protein [Phycisphaerae bacterium]
MTDVRTSSPPRAWNRTYHVLGALALAVNKLRYALLGYRRPRGFGPAEIDRCVKYDFQVVENWLGYLEAYLGKPVEIKGKNILELGPGQDLGIGLILLAKGARKYNAVDAHDLLAQSSENFYEALFRRLEKDSYERATIAELHRQLECVQSGRANRLNYLCRKDFDLSVLEGEQVDFVFSQAAFEHFDDVARTIEQLNQVVCPGAVFLAVIDLQTHTRWLRERDPLNIYRYSDSYYRLCRYTGQPNRLRPV